MAFVKKLLKRIDKLVKMQSQKTNWRYFMMNEILSVRLSDNRIFKVSQFAKRKAKKLKLEFSDKLEDIGDEKKFVLIVLPLHQLQPSDLQGIPFAPVCLLPTTGQGVIFFDELNLAAPMLLRNVYQLIENRRLGSYTVPNGYILRSSSSMNSIGV